MSAFIKNAKKNREGEHIGGGFWVFRRGDGTGRIRPSNWPFEYATAEAAAAQARVLASTNPGKAFQVVGVVSTHYSEPVDVPAKPKEEVS